MNLKHSRGFTLIEVLVALTILAIALVSVTFAVSKGVKDMNHLRDKLASHAIAMNVLTRMQVGLLPLPEQSGESALLGKNYSWIAKIDNENGQQSNDFYERVYVEVQPQGSLSNTARVVGFVKTSMDSVPETESG